MKFTKCIRGLQRRNYLTRLMWINEMDKSLRMELNNIRLRHALAAVLEQVDIANSSCKINRQGFDFMVLDLPLPVVNKLREAKETQWHDEEGLDSV